MLIKMHLNWFDFRWHMQFQTMIWMVSELINLCLSSRCSIEHYHNGEVLCGNLKYFEFKSGGKWIHWKSSLKLAKHATSLSSFIYFIRSKQKFVVQLLLCHIILQQAVQQSERILLLIWCTCYLQRMIAGELQKYSLYTALL